MRNDRSSLALSRRELLGAACAVALPSAAAGQAAPAVWQNLVEQPPRPLKFVSRSGAIVDLAALTGHPLLINLWATWCGPCVVELPALDRLQRAYGARLTVIPVSVDRDGFAAIDYAYQRLKIRSLGAYCDADMSFANALGLESLPASWVVSANGGFLARRRGGASWDDAEERTALDRFIS